MKKGIYKTIACLFAISLILGCKSPRAASDEEKGAVIGGVGGAVLGGAIADDTLEGALIGGAIGGLAGAYIGNKMDEQAQDIRREVPSAQVQRQGEGIHITFDERGGTDFQTLDAQSRAKLDRLANVFRQYPNTNILIEGHSADVGSRSRNLSASKQRAQSVADYLVDQGVSRGRLTTNWYGASRPVATGAPNSNRRVEIGVVANEELRREARRAADR